MKIHFQNKGVLAGLIFLLVFSVYILTWSPLFMGYEKETMLSAREFFHGNYQIFRAGLFTILLYQPFIAISQLLSPTRADMLLALVPLFYSALTSSVLFLIFEKLTKKTFLSISASLPVAFGSLLWPYSRIGMEYSAGLMLCILLLTLLYWQEGKISPLVVGAVLAGTVLTKSYGILFAVPVFIFVAVQYANQKEFKKILSPTLLCKLFGFSVLGVATVFFINHSLYGQWQGIYFLKQEFQVYSWWEGFFGAFFSFGKSVFLYSPLLIPAAYFWPRFFREHKAISYFILSTFLLLTLLTLPFSYWSDETLAVRKLVPAIALLHIPLVFLWDKRSNWKNWLLGIFVAAAMYVQFINTIYPYWRQLELLRPYNQDTLEVLRYNPRLSHLALNNDFFVSYVEDRIIGKPKTFNYFERAWMRQGTEPASGNPLLVKINISLAPYEKPDVYILGPAQKSIRTAFALLFLGIAVFSGILLYKKCYTKDN